MKTTSFDRTRWSELISVVIAVAAAAFLFFEIIRSQLPSSLQRAIEQQSISAAWAVAVALGLSLLCVGIGVISVSAVRLAVALRTDNSSRIFSAAKDQLGSVVMVVSGFVLAVAAAFMLSQYQP
jgi:ABC-type Fe3+ transport system permease subunit